MIYQLLSLYILVFFRHHLEVSSCTFSEGKREKGKITINDSRRDNNSNNNKNNYEDGDNAKNGSRSSSNISSSTTITAAASAQQQQAFTRKTNDEFSCNAQSPCGLVMLMAFLGLCSDFFVILIFLSKQHSGVADFVHDSCSA